MLPVTEKKRNWLAWRYFQIQEEINANSYKLQKSKKYETIEKLRNRNLRLSEYYYRLRKILNANNQQCD